MEIPEMLDELKQKALHDENLRQELLGDQRRSTTALTAFCRKCQENGYPIYEMELILAGEEFYATMKRSTNGRWRELTDVGGGR